MTRVALSLSVAAVVLLSAGCTAPSQQTAGPMVFEEETVTSDVGRPAAEVARSRMRHYQDIIDQIARECADMSHRRVAALEQAKAFRRQASRTAFAADLSSLERKAYAAQYREMALHRESEAARYAELIAAYGARTRILRSKWHRQEALAHDFQGIRTRGPE